MVTDTQSPQTGYGPHVQSLRVLRSAVGKTHDLRSDLWWTIPLHILLDHFGIPLGFQPIKSTLLTLRCPGACDFPPWGSRGHDNQYWYLPVPTGLHGLCFGFCFAGPVTLRSLSHGPLLRVHFGESLVIDYTQKSTILTSAVKLSVSAIFYSRWTATLVVLNKGLWADYNKKHFPSGVHLVLLSHGISFLQLITLSEETAHPAAYHHLSQLSVYRLIKFRQHSGVQMQMTQVIFC